jgi:hypothetical protein
MASKKNRSSSSCDLGLSGIDVSINVIEVVGGRESASARVVTEGSLVATPFCLMMTAKSQLRKRPRIKVK